VLTKAVGVKKPGTGVMIVCGGVGCTPYLPILSQLSHDLRHGVNNVRFVLVCRGRGLLEFLKPRLEEYALRGIKVDVYVTKKKDGDAVPLLEEGTVTGHGEGVPVQPHPLLPGCAPQSSSLLRRGVAVALSLAFWVLTFYFSLRLCYYFHEEVQDQHVVESRLWLPLWLVVMWIGVGLVLNMPVVKTLLWGVGTYGVEMKGVDGREQRERSRSMSMEKSLMGGVEYEDVEVEEELFGVYEGRPDLDELLGDFKGDVFTCGPEPLKEDVKRACGVQCAVGKGGRQTGAAVGRCGVRIWEEIFEW